MDREVDQSCRAVLPDVAAPNDKTDLLTLQFRDRIQQSLRVFNRKAKQCTKKK
jgi:hypothetical protein